LADFQKGKYSKIIYNMAAEWREIVTFKGYVSLEWK